MYRRIPYQFCHACCGHDFVYEALQRMQAMTQGYVLTNVHAAPFDPGPGQRITLASLIVSGTKLPHGCSHQPDKTMRSRAKFLVQMK